VERTPEEYFDNTSSIEAERAAAVDEVRARLLAFVGAVSRGSATEAMIALNPASTVQLVAPRELELNGGASVREVVEGWVTTPVSVHVQEVEVDVAPDGQAAWFRMVVEAPGASPEPTLYHATGTYVRDAGLWELVQAHISGPVTTDSLSSLPDSAATPEEGE